MHHHHRCRYSAETVRNVQYISDKEVGYTAYTHVTALS